MEMKKWFAIPIIALLTLGIAGVALAVNRPIGTSTEIETDTFSGVKLSGVNIPISTQYGAYFTPASEKSARLNGIPFGQESLMGWEHNVFTGAGQEHVEGLLRGAITTGLHVKYLALGNGSVPVNGSTTLSSEQTLCGLARALGDDYDLGNGWWEVNDTYTFTCGNSMMINATASFNASSGGTMFAGGSITEVTFTTNGDQLRLRHNNTISEA